jgi:DNA-binding transcriptional ArsR family regulator
MVRTLASDRNGTVHPSWLPVLTDPVRLNLLRCLCGVGTVTAPELMPLANASERTVRRHLEVLVELGLAEERRGQSDGETRGRPAASYTLSVPARRQVLALFDLLRQPLGGALPPSTQPPPAR